MMKKTHLIGGVSFGVMAYKLNTILDIYNPIKNFSSLSQIDHSLFSMFLIVSVLAYGLGSIVGSLLPDIDTPNSFLGSRFKIISIPISRTFKHRTITHSIWFALFNMMLFVLMSLFVADVLIKGLLVSYGIGLLVGIISHIVLDCITIVGVPVFYPISKKKISFTKLKTGGFGETLTAVSLVIITLFTTYTLF